MNNSSERIQILLDQTASGQLSRRRFLTAVNTTGLAAVLSGAAVEHALAAGENQAINQAQLKGAYDYIVVGGGASGSIIAGELSKTGADVLIVESGGADTGPAISNPSIWFYNVGGPARLEAANRAGPPAGLPKVQHGARACGLRGSSISSMFVPRSRNSNRRRPDARSPSSSEKRSKTEKQNERFRHCSLRSRNYCLAAGAP